MLLQTPKVLQRDSTFPEILPIAKKSTVDQSEKILKLQATIKDLHAKAQQQMEQLDQVKYSKVQTEERTDELQMNILESEVRFASVLQQLSKIAQEHALPHEDAVDLKRHALALKLSQIDRLKVLNNY